MQVSLERAGQDPSGSEPQALQESVQTSQVRRAASRADARADRDAGALTWLAIALIVALVLLATGWIAAQMR